MDDVLDFARAAVALVLDDFAREDDVFEVEDGEVVIFKFVRGVGCNDLAERTNQVAELRDRHLGHGAV